MDSDGRISDRIWGLSQQEELGGDGGEKGGYSGFFHFHGKVKVPLVFIIAVFMYFIQCLMRTCVESARNKYFTDFEASNCSNRHIRDRSKQFIEIVNNKIGPE